MPDDRTPRKRRGRTTPGSKALPTDRAGDVADLSDDEVAARLLGTRPARERAGRPLWLTVIKWLCLVCCAVVFPLGLCVLCSWLLWRFPGATLRRRLHGVRVVGKVVGNQDGFGGGENRSYQAIVAYTFEGVPTRPTRDPKGSRPGGLANRF